VSSVSHSQRKAGQILATLGIGIQVAVGIDIDIMSQPPSMRRLKICMEFDTDSDSEGCRVVLSAACHFDEKPERRSLSRSHGQRLWSQSVNEQPARIPLGFAGQRFRPAPSLLTWPDGRTLPLRCSGLMHQRYCRCCTAAHNAQGILWRLPACPGRIPHSSFPCRCPYRFCFPGRC